MTIKTLRGHSSFVFCLNYNAASTLVVSGACDGDVRLWNPKTGMLHVMSAVEPCLIFSLGKCTMTINAHLDYVTAVNFNRDSSLLVSCSLDGLMYGYPWVTDILC
jgi:COMPASS component SWD3